MSDAITDLSQLLRSLHPVLNDGVYAFVAAPRNAALPPVELLATFREKEGLTLILEEQQARAAQLEVLFRAAWITLTVHSNLQAVGLTAAVSTELTRAGISCNVVAAAYHDHLFVPVESAQQAVAVLQALQKSHAG